MRTPFNVTFNTEFSDEIYRVDSPEIVHAASGASVAMRYRSTNQPAASAYAGAYRTFVAGFPFEAILSASERDKMMSAVLGFLIK